MSEKKEFPIHLEAPGIGPITVLTKIIAIPQPGGFYNPQYQIVGATPEDTAKLCQIKDVQAFLDYSRPGALTNNGQDLADALGGSAASPDTVEGLPHGAELNVPERLETQARQTITDTINRCKATLRDGYAPDTTSNDGRFAVPGSFERDAFGGAGVTPTAPRTNAPIFASPAFGTRNAPAPAPSPSSPSDTSGGVEAAKAPVPAGATRRLTSIYPEVGPLGPNAPGPRSGSDALSGLVGRQPNAPSFPPVWFPPAALLAPGRDRALGDWVKPLPFKQPALPAQDVPGGIPGLLMQIGAFDPSHPDDPPAGGLLRLIQDYMRNNPDGGVTR